MSKIIKKTPLEQHNTYASSPDFVLSFTLLQYEQ